MITEFRQTSHVPVALLVKLGELGGSKYSEFVTVFHCIRVHATLFVGVVGDGANGAYEWFVFRPVQLGESIEVSDKGYGDTIVALRDVLSKEVA